MAQKIYKNNVVKPEDYRRMKSSKKQKGKNKKKKK